MWGVPQSAGSGDIALESSATFRVGLEPWFENQWTMNLLPVIIIFYLGG